MKSIFELVVDACISLNSFYVLPEGRALLEVNVELENDSLIVIASGMDVVVCNGNKKYKMIEGKIFDLTDNTLIDEISFLNEIIGLETQDAEEVELSTEEDKVFIDLVDRRVICQRSLL